MSLREDADGNETQAIEDLATGSVELTAALWDFYRRAHEWDVPAGRGTEAQCSGTAQAQQP